MARRLALWRSKAGFPRLRHSRPALALRRGAAARGPARADLDGALARRTGPARPSMPTRSSTRTPRAMSGEPVVARIGGGVAAFDAADWDACAGDGRSLPQPRLPLRARGIRAAPSRETGWRPLPIAIDGPDGRPAAVMPAYLKSHWLGEYVFDHGWADAYERAGGRLLSQAPDRGAVHAGAGAAPAGARSGARAGPDRGGGAGGRGERPLLGARDLHRPGRGRACSSAPAG